MKIKFNVDSIVNQLAVASNVVGTKVVGAPILNDFVIKTYNKRKQAIVTASDGELWLEIKFELICEESGEDFEFAVGAKEFVSTLRGLSGYTVEIALDQESHTIKGTYENGYFSIPFESSEGFPRPFVNDDKRTEKTIDAQKILLAIESTKFAAATKSITRPQTNGIHFDFEEEMMTAMATDTSKMSIFDDTTIKSESGFTFCFTISNKTVNLLCQMLQKVDGDIKVSSGGNNLVVSRHDFRVMAKLLEGKYPNCKRVVPKSNKIVVTICRDDLAASIKRVMPLGNQSTKMVVMEFSEGSVALKSRDVDFSKEASNSLKCDYSGELFRIGFNGNNMLETIANFNDDNLLFKMSEAKQATIIVPETQDSEVVCTCLLMPMTL